MISINSISALAFVCQTDENQAINSICKQPINIKSIIMNSTNKFAVFAFGIAVLVSCSKNSNDNTVIVTPTVPASNPIAPGNISGFVKGTLTTGNTYTITGDLTVKAGDTLASQQGVTIIVKGNAQINIQGVLNIVGTKDQPVYFNSDTKVPGSWGGFQCDSAKAVTIKWTHIDNTGGPDLTGSPRKSVFVAAPIDVVIEDSWFTNGQDDLIRIQKGARLSVLRNTIISSGSTDGEAINLKTGTTGKVAYNVIYSQAGTGIKLETSALVPLPQTNVDVFNNTLVSNGWRRGAAEPGRGISAGVNAKGNFYNNLIVNNYQGIEIFTDADTANIKYGNTLFYASTDIYSDTTTHPNISINIRNNFYPADGVGRPKTTDLISAGTADLNPMFVLFDGKIATPNGASTTNDFHIKAGSPAFGKGNATYNNDIGAYTADGKGNQH